jgi:putative tryptophan/tyrosine transport system substrate-binding protein
MSITHCFYKRIFKAAFKLGWELGTRIVPRRQRLNAIDGFAHEPNGGLVVPPDIPAIVHRDLIISLTNRHHLPAVYAYRTFGSAGGLACYGTDITDLHRRAADYVNRILRGEKAADLPVQTPTKYELVINLKTAKALGLEVPPTLLARADEVIDDGASS